MNPDSRPSWIRDLVIAGTFLTRLPFGVLGPVEPEPLSGAMRVFPLIGLLVGFLGWAVLAFAERLGLPAGVGALLAILATVLVTGGLHEDGLADTADGWGAGGDAARKLAIMRDSRTGTYGVLALVFSVGLRAAALATLSVGEAGGALLAGHVIGRAAIPLIMRLTPPARVDGLGAMAGNPPDAALAWCAGAAIILALVVLGVARGLLALLAAGLAIAGLARLARRHIGGYTGDVLGAAEQFGEIAVLLSAAVAR